MASHKNQTAANGIHTTAAWEVTDNTARDALPVSSPDIGKVARVGAAAPYTFYILKRVSPIAWDQVGGGAGLGDVTGPASSVDNRLPRFLGTSGKAVDSTGVSCDDSNNLSGIGNISLSGTVDGRDVSVDGITLDATAAALPAKAARRLTIKTVAATTYTFVAGDAVDTLVVFTASSPVTATVPSGVFTAGDVVPYYQKGTGTVTVAPGGGVTLQNPIGASGFGTLGQTAMAALTSVATNEFKLTGEIS